MLGGPLDELIDGATTVANGLRYVCRSVAQRMADSLTHTSLTSREFEVLSLVERVSPTRRSHGSSGSSWGRSSRT